MDENIPLMEDDGWVFVANPADKELLRELGANADTQLEMSCEERVELLFSDARRKDAIELGAGLPEIPPIAAPEVVALYREIIDCVLVGAHGAAITMATILVEFALKYTVFVCEVGGYGRDDPDMWDELEQATFYPVTRRACASGLIDDKQVEILDRFREQVRNPYAHYNVRKITKGNIWQNVMVYNKETAQTEVRDIAAEDNPVIRAQIKPHFDRANVLIVIANADEIVRELFRNMEAIIASNNPES